MADRTEGSTEIHAAPEAIMHVLTDFDAYPEWAGVKTAAVRARDSKGRPTEVAFEVSQMGVGASYTLAYAYSRGGRGMSWTSTEAGGAVRDIQGEYVLAPVDAETTIVKYRTAIETAIPLMGFMKRQAERLIIDMALGGLKRRVERG